MKTLDKYILREMLSPFLISFSVISFALILGRLVDLIGFIAAGVSPLKLLSLIASALTASLGFSIPPAFLVACTTAFGRLSSDLEIVAVKSVGISVRRIAAAALLGSLALSVFLVFVNFFVAPLGQKATKGLAVEIMLSRKNLGVTEHGFTEFFKNVTVYVTDKKNGWLKKIFIFDMRNPEKFYVVEAERGKIVRNQKGRLVFYLENGRIIAQGKTIQVLNFKKYSILFTTDIRDIFKKPVKKELTILELMKRIDRERKKGKKKHFLESMVHLYKRLALAFSPLIFALVGIPISISFHKKEKWASFLISLALFFGYFGILSFSQNLVYQGVPPFLCAWLPNIILGGIGVFLFYKRMEAAV